jgi:hypothetical protein
MAWENNSKIFSNFNYQVTTVDQESMEKNHSYYLLSMVCEESKSVLGQADTSG